jgi:hypothetical protein
MLATKKIRLNCSHPFAAIGLVPGLLICLSILFASRLAVAESLEAMEAVLNKAATLKEFLASRSLRDEGYWFSLEY